MPHEPNQTPTIQMRELLLRSVREVERLRAELAAVETRAREPIAIVGVGLRTPGGVRSLDELWSVLARGEDLVREVPPTRWDARTAYDPEPGVPGRTYVNAAAFCDEVASFDPGFFGVSPREARSLDPQYRILLEAAWEALERAQIVPASLAGSATGVYVGAGPSEYARLQSAETGDAYAVMGTHPSFAAGRIAFHLGVHGPALTVDTACSSSLVALHLARAALLADECELALAAGVQVMAGPEGFIHLSSTRTVAPDGRCKTFSAAADGYGRGEGVVVLALTRRSRAEAAGYPILGLIRGSAVNHDGASNGITAPSGGAQQQVIRAALDDAALGPEAIDLVECHGTGTQLGDPIEVQALGAVYGRGRPAARGPLLIGTVKTNLGHLESAAGLAGVAKLLACLGRDAIAPSLRSRPLNPLVDWDALGVEVVDALRPWPTRAGQPRRAAVSAFGLSGTNAHVIIEEPPRPAAQAAPPSAAEPQAMVDELEPPGALPLLISGRSEAALRAQAEALRAHLDDHHELVDGDRGLVDLAASLALTRQHFEHRACVIARRGEGRATLAGLAELAREGHQSATAISDQLGPRVAKQVWMFSGQGAQYPGMGRALYRTHAPFRAAFDACCEAFGEALGARVRELVVDAAAPELADRLALDQTGLTQPALFAYELALARALEAWGLRPAWVMGHSIGELVAACVAGLWSLTDACTLVATRARLMQSLTPAVAGAMRVIEAPEAAVSPILAEHPGVEIAGINGPRATVISGDAPAIATLSAALANAGHRCRELRVSHAFHSAHMDAIVDEFAAAAARVEYREPSVALISTRTGALASAAELREPSYWARQLREAVRFGPAIAAAEQLGAGLFVELGPHGVLGPMAHASLSEAGRDSAKIVALAHRRRDPIASCARGLAALHCAGVEIDWRAHFARFGPTRISLPTYAFVRERYWTEARPGASVAPRQGRAGDYALAGQRVELCEGAALHTLDIGPRLQPYLGDHAVYSTLVVPGSFYLSVLLAVGHARWPAAGIELRAVEFVRALRFAGPEDRVALHVELRPGPEPQTLAAIVFSVADEVRREHARAQIRPLAGPALDRALAEASPPPRDGEARDLSALERALEAVEIDWGPRWWWLEHVNQLGPREASGRLRPPPGETGDDAPVACGFIDNSFGLQAWARGDGLDTDEVSAQLPFGVERMLWFGPRRAPAARAALRCDQIEADSTISTLRYWDADDRPLAQIEGFTTRRAPRERLLGDHDERGAQLYRPVWRPLSENGRAPRAGAIERCESLTRWLDARPEHHDDEAQTPPAQLVYELDGAGHSARTLTVTVLAELQRWLATPALARSTQLVIATRGAVSLEGDAAVDLAAAPVWGLVRAAASEHPELGLALVDCDLAAPREAQDAALREALARPEPELALRSAGLLTPQLEPVPPAPVRGSRGQTPRVDRPAGSALITGASGHVGRHLARHLVAAHGVRELVLVSRRGDQAPELRELAAALEAEGTRVHVAACDVAAREALAALMSRLPALVEAPLRTIIHCAGVLDDGTFASLEPAQVERVFAAKVDGARHLDALSRALELDAFVLCSSASATLGAAGQANYAAANAWLDALAGARRAAGLAGLSLAWGPWAGGGMAEALAAQLRRRGVRPLSPARAVALFDRALAEAPAPILVPIALDRGRLAELAAAGERVAPVLREFLGPTRAPVDEASSAQAALAALSGRARIDAVHDRVTREVGAILELPPAELEPARDLRDYGLDSLMALELRNRLQRVLATNLPSTVVLDHPTCAALERLILDRLPEAPAGETPVDDSEPPAAIDEARVLDYLALQRDRASAPRDEHPAGRRALGLLELLDRFINDAFTAGQAKLRETLMLMREHADQSSSPAQPRPVCLTGDARPIDACVYAIPAFGFPSSPLQFVQIAAACRALEGGDGVGLWSAANPGVEAGVALPRSLDEIVDYHVAAVDEVRARTGRRPAIMGFSSGGWLAAAVAARLEADGRPVPGLVLLDSSHPRETSAAPIERMFVSNAIRHHIDSGGDDELFIHELTGMFALMALGYHEWRELSLAQTPALHIASEVGFDFPRWGLVFKTDPRRHWGPHIETLDVVCSAIDHFALLTEGAPEVAAHTCAYARDWSPTLDPGALEP